MSNKDNQATGGASIERGEIEGGGRGAATHACEEKATVSSSASSAERLAMLSQPIWIDYPAARAVLDGLHDLIDAPQDSDQPHLAVLGEHGSGRNSIIDRLVSERDGQLHPIRMRMPISASGPAFWTVLAMTIAMTRGSKPGLGSKRERRYALGALAERTVGPGLLVVSQTDMLCLASTNKRAEVFEALALVASEARMRIVLLGYPKVWPLVQRGASSPLRFDPLRLPRWGHDAGFEQFLRAWEAVLPLRRASDLPSYGVRLIEASEGSICHVAAILRLAAMEAIRSGEECIGPDLMDRMCRRHGLSGEFR